MLKYNYILIFRDGKVPQNLVNNVIIVRFNSEPNRDTEPTINDIIYNGTDECFIYDDYGVGGSYWFAFYSENNNGYSKVESYDKYQENIPTSHPKMMISTSKYNINMSAKATAKNIVI